MLRHVIEARRQERKPMSPSLFARRRRKAYKRWSRHTSRLSSAWYGALRHIAENGTQVSSRTPTHGMNQTGNARSHPMSSRRACRCLSRTPEQGCCVENGDGGWQRQRAETPEGVTARAPASPPRTKTEGNGRGRVKVHAAQRKWQ